MKRRDAERDMKCRNLVEDKAKLAGLANLTKSGTT